MKPLVIIAAALIALVAISLIVLGSIAIPAPSGQIEKTIPADRLPH